jgi:hypothetical protein
VLLPELGGCCRCGPTSTVVFSTTFYLEHFSNLKKAVKIKKNIFVIKNQLLSCCQRRADEILIKKILHHHCSRTPTWCIIAMGVYLLSFLRSFLSIVEFMLLCAEVANLMLPARSHQSNGGSFHEIIIIEFSRAHSIPCLNYGPKHRQEPNNDACVYGDN